MHREHTVSSALPAGAPGQGAAPSIVPGAWHANGRAIPLLVLFAVQVGFWGGLGTTETTRLELLIAAVAQIVVIGLGYLWLTVGPRQRPGGWAIVRQDRLLFGVLAAWIAIATIAAVNGALAGNQVQYVLGDYYKFAILPLIVLLAYLAMETEGQLGFVLRWTMVLFGAILVYDFARFYPLLAQGHRFTSNAVDMIATLAPLICYLLHEPSSRTFAVLGAAVFAEVMLTLSFGQLLGGFLGFALSLGLLFWLLRQRIALVLMAVVIFTFAVNMMGGIPIAIKPTSSPDRRPGLLPFRVTILDTYMRGKLNAATSSQSVPSAAEAVGGSRAAEIVAIVRKIGGKPLKIALGFGLGGTVEPVALGGTRLYWERPKHYVHAGLFEVLYRSGVIGLAVFLAFFVVLIRRALRVHAAGRHPFAAFVIVNTIVQAVLLAFTAPLMSPYLFLALSFAGLAAIERGHGTPVPVDAQATRR